MVAFGHTAVGASVGVLTYHLLGSINPAEGLFISGTFGVASHYIADSIPHGHFFSDKDFHKYIKLDIVFNLFFSILIFFLLSFARHRLGLETWYVLFGIGGAQLPDIYGGVFFVLFKKPPKILQFEYILHYKISHWHGGMGNALMWDFKRDIWQIVVFFISAYLVLFH